PAASNTRPSAWISSGRAWNIEAARRRAVSRRWTVSAVASTGSVTGGPVLDRAAGTGTCAAPRPCRGLVRLQAPYAHGRLQCHRAVVPAVRAPGARGAADGPAPPRIRAGERPGPPRARRPRREPGTRPAGPVRTPGRGRRHAGEHGSRL